MRRNDLKLKGKLVDCILRTSGHAARDHREKIVQIVKDLFGTTDEPAMNYVKKEPLSCLESMETAYYERGSSCYEGAADCRCSGRCTANNNNNTILHIRILTALYGRTTLCGV